MPVPHCELVVHPVHAPPVLLLELELLELEDEVQSPETQAQLAAVQLALAGPVPPPPVHVERFRHQPQPAAPVHTEQERCVVHAPPALLLELLLELDDPQSDEQLVRVSPVSHVPSPQYDLPHADG